MSHHESEQAVPRLISESEAAAHLHQSLSTLRRWRRQGNGPTFVRFGRMVFYQPRDLEDFIAAHRRNQEAE